MAADNFAVWFEPTDPACLEGAIAAAREAPPDLIGTPVDEAAVAGLKFGGCLPPDLARSVFAARLSDPAAVADAVRRPCRAVVVG